MSSRDQARAVGESLKPKSIHQKCLGVIKAKPAFWLHQAYWLHIDNPLNPKMIIRKKQGFVDRELFA